MNKRMNYIDMARGVAIILVMAGHSVLFPACGAIHIPTFFVLAGYVITMESTGKYTFKECVRKRSLRLLWPYVFYSAVLLALQIIKDIISGGFKISESLLDIFGIIYSSTFIFSNTDNKFLCFRVGNEGLWFLTSMICASIVFYFIIYKFAKNIFRPAIIAGSCVMLIAVQALIEKTGFCPPWGFDIALMGTAFMFFGMYLRRTGVLYDIKKTVILVIVSGIGFLVLNYINGEANMAIHLYGKSHILFYISGLCSSSFIIGVCRLAEKASVIQKALSYVGTNTLFILAFHTMIFGILDKVMDAAGIDFAGIWIPRLIVTLIICLAVKYVCRKVVHIPDVML